MKHAYIGIGLILSLIGFSATIIWIASWPSPYHTAHVKAYYRQLPSEPTENRCNFVGSSVNLSGGCGYGVHVTTTGIKMGFSYY